MSQPQDPPAGTTQVEEPIPLIEQALREKDKAPASEPVLTTEPAVLTPEEEQHEEDMEKAGKNFAKVIWEKTRKGAGKFWHWMKRGAKATGHGIVTATKATGRAISWTARKGWSGLKAVGRGTRWFLSALLAGVGKAIYYPVMWLMTGLIFVVGLLSLGILYLGLIIVKIVHFIGLVLVSPWLWLKDKQALKDNWRLFRVGIKPKNLEQVVPAPLATRTLRERVEARRQRVAQRAAANESAQRAAQARETKKGKSTPRRQQGRGRPLPTPSPAQG